MVCDVVHRLDRLPKWGGGFYFTFHDKSVQLFNTTDRPSNSKEMSMNELTTVTQRDKWEAKAEKHKEEALAIAEEFKRNPDANPFLEGNKK